MFDNLKKELENIGNEVKVLYQHNLESSAASYRLINSINYKVKYAGNKYIVCLELEDYWKNIEYGRKPGTFPNVESLIKWIKDKPIPIGNDILTSSEIEIIKSKLSENNITFKVDDSDKTPGFKFAESEVNGTPIRIEIGKRDLENKKVTLVRRDTREKISVDINEAIDKVKFLLTDIQDNLYNRALERMNALTFEASTMSEMESIIKEHPGFIKADWCGRSECEVKLKDKTSIKSRCILENEKLITGKCAICGKPAKELVIWGIQY